MYSKIDDLSFLHVINIEVYLSHLTPVSIVNPLKVDSKCKLHHANELFKEKKQSITEILPAELPLILMRRNMTS